MAYSPKEIRADLPSVTSRVYLNAGTFGPMPRAVAAAMHERVESSLVDGRIGTPAFLGFLELQENVRAGFARVVGAKPDEISLQHCTTDGVNVVASAFPFERGDQILTTTHEHPGLLDPIEEVARAQGVEVTFAEPTLAAISEKINARTRLVALSHVLWTNGAVLPIRDIARAVHARGAELLVDGAQSAGAIEVAVHELEADYYTVSGQKWLMGPSSTGALFVHPSRLARLRTPWPSYFSKQRDTKGAHAWSDSHRLDATTLSATALVGMNAALAFHEQETRAGALTYAMALAEDLRARLRKEPQVRLLEVAAPSTLVSFSLPGKEPAAVVKKLERAEIFVRYIPGFDCVRASVGFWNDASDLGRFLSALLET